MTNQTSSCSRPLIVDLNGTLLKSDFLIEQIFAFLKRNPLRLFSILAWLVRGRCYLKAGLAGAVDLDVSRLPYDQTVLAWLREQRLECTSVILATATHERQAQRIREHLGLFDDVMATNSERNLSSTRKRDALIERFGRGGFDYVGNSAADLPVWAAAHDAYLVNPEPGVERRARREARVRRVTRTNRSWAGSLMRALRPHQWLKNLLVLVPAAAAHASPDGQLLVQAVSAFAAFSLCSSSVYVLNDLVDLEDDRAHARKQYRPIAAGDLPLVHAVYLVPVLLLSSVLIAVAFLPLLFVGVLAIYYGLTLSYSFGLKRVMLVDAFTLAVLYTARIIAGATAFSLDLTFWILAFSMFIFLSLALLKRYTELMDLRFAQAGSGAPGRGYQDGDLEILASLGTASGFLAVLVVALYIEEAGTRTLYSTPQLIWLACPILLYWISRVWLKAHRGEMHDDPVIFAVKDRVSQITGALFVGLFVAASL